jgi:3-oxoacyl-[acyl-carrier-protein] synthase II
MAVTAAEEAMRSASIDARRSRVGLVIGGTTGGMFENEELLARLHVDPRCGESPRSMLSHPLTSTGDLLDGVLGPFARVRTLSSACSSSANALIVAALWLQGALGGDAELDAVVAGGSDGLCRLTFAGFNALGAIDPEPCRPFDRRRRGTSLGEGAGFVVLERADRARARGAQPVAQLAGWALGSEAHHITNPAPDGATIASLIGQALERAMLTPADVDYVSAHGTGTPLNDPIEAAALARAFGRDADRIAVSSSKGQIGHTLGAAGAIEAVITALVVSRRTLVPTVGLDEPDPAIRLVHVPHVGRMVPRVRAAISNAFGFGGMDSVLVFVRPRDDAAPAAPIQAFTAPTVPRAAGEGSGAVDPAGAGAASISLRAAEGSGVADRVGVGSEDARVACVVTGASVLGPCGLLGADDCAILAERALDARAVVDPEAHLDLDRVRRLDRASRFAAAAAGRALRDAGAPPARTGVVFGRAFGNVDGSAAFMHRIFDRGPRAASPAEFPNLVPSAPVGHVSIYLGLHGPSFMTADLSTSGESAFIQAVELVATGAAPSVVAGAVEARSVIVEDVLARLFAPVVPGGGHRPEIAAALVVESRPAAAQRGARVLASVEQRLEWRRDGRSAIVALNPPRAARAEVVLSCPDASLGALLGASSWSSCSPIVLGAVVGESDALGAVALAVAVGRLASGCADEALVLGVAKQRGCAVVLRRE